MRTYTCISLVFCLLMFYFFLAYLVLYISLSIISGEHTSIGSASLCTHAVLCTLQLHVKYTQIQIQILTNEFLSKKDLHTGMGPSY